MKPIDIENLENLATKALGVLQEQGVYAMMVFLLSRSGDKALENYIKDIKDHKEKIVAVQLIKNLGNSLGEEPLKKLKINLLVDFNKSILSDMFLDPFIVNGSL